jgi:hypothetical protein
MSSLSIKSGFMKKKNEQVRHGWMDGWMEMHGWMDGF